MNRLFNSARLRLTGLWLLIIMSISLTFSAIIYVRFSAEIARIYHFQQTQQAFFHNEHNLDIDLNEDLYGTARAHLIANIAFINSLIFLVAGALGYILAGKILRPINETMEEQRRFIADASHELRTPLTAMKTETEVALRAPTLSSDDAHAVIKSNLEEINKLRDLTDALLTLANSDAHTALESRTSGDVAAIIDAAVAQVKPLADRAQITITTENTHGNFIADHVRLTQLLVILLDNAIKYSHAGGTVQVNSRFTDDFLEFVVRDHGIGIAADQLPHIFKRFYRADEARTKEHGSGGYGLGLSIAQQIVEQHQGTLTVTSAPNQGTSMLVQIPRD